MKARLIRPQLLYRACIALDHHDARRTARRRLKAERPAAREQIEATLAVQALAQPVEERFAHAVGCRAQAVEIENG